MGKRWRASRGLGRWRARWQVLLVGLLGGAVVVAATVVPGYRLADVHLDEGSVYVSKGGPATVGQLNHQIDQIVQARPLAETTIEMLQEGSTVLVRSDDANILQQWDLVTNQFGAPSQLPSGAQLVLNGGALGVVSPLTGAMWYGSPATVLGIDFAKAEARYEAGQNARLVLTSKGNPLVLSLRDNALVRPPTKEGAEAKVTKLPFVLGPEGDVELSAVGERAVVLDRRTNQLWVEGEQHPILFDGALSAHLAAPAPRELQLGKHTVKAFLATPAGLLGVTSNGSLVNLTPGAPQASPITPVVARGCVYGVLGTTFTRACRDGEPTIVEIPSLPAGAELVLRTNRDTVVLNDTRSGLVWLVDKDMLLVDEWDHAVEQETNSTKDVQDDRTEQMQLDRNKPNSAPQAKPDELKAREGRTTLLPVLDNDNDPDGDILTLTQAPTPSAGTLALVRGGTQLQLDAGPGLAGQRVSFGYEISDGRGGTAQSSASVTIITSDQTAENTPPRQRHSETTVISAGARLQLRVLPNWRDPEGDDLFLVKAEMDGTDDIVSFTPDGLLTYQDVANSDGPKTIKVAVSDGLATTEGKVSLLVQKDPGQPIANGDYEQTTVGQEIVVSPLANDIGVNTVLAQVGKALPTGPTVTPNYLDSTFRFVADKAGTYYVDYTATTGPNAYGVVRIDVREATGSNQPPVPVRDVVQLPAGGAALIDPLLNDEDADGDVLALQSVTEDPRLVVQMQDRHLLTVRALTVTSEPIRLGYQVSDGQHSVEGSIVVVPATEAADVRPVAVSDETSVRANDIATINVLANDYSPAGSRLTVDRELVENPGDLAWVDGERVRFHAPSVAGTYRVVYQVHDEFGRATTSYVRFNVTAVDADNRAPQPTPIVGRVLAGTTARLPVALDGVDPNGDSVRLLGIASGPRLGRIVGVGERWLQYEAYPGSRGTDTFSYEVVDARGLRGVASVRVGVVPPSDANSAPVALDDTIASRPGRTVRIPLLANDMDPDGDRIQLMADKLQLQFEGRALPAQIVHDTDVELTLPDRAGVVLGAYSVEDVRGGRTTANIRIDVSPDAPLLPPVLRDDLVAADQVLTRNDVDVAVLGNDYDPDGDLAQATLSIPKYECEAAECARIVDPAGQAKLPPEERTVHAPVLQHMALVRYAVTDADGLSATGVMIVPGMDDRIPAMKPDIVEETVRAGSELDLDITKYFAGRDGRNVNVSSEQLLWASHGTAVTTSARSIRFHAEEGYVGPGSVVVDVTDGTSINDPDGRRAVLTIPIKVVPAPSQEKEGDNRPDELNSPPTVPPLTLTVGAGEEATVLDVAGQASDPDGDSLRFDRPQGAVPTGVEVEWDGLSRLTGRASVDAAPGTRSRLTGVVKDGRGGEAPVVVDVVVVGSSKPRAAVVDDVEPRANQGKELVIPVLANDVSPFPDKPLVLESVALESGSPSSGPRVDGDSVVVTPAASFVGNMVLRYTVSDATKQPDRFVDGRVRITVRGVPSQPKPPVWSDQQGNINRQVTLTWQEPDDNGAPITSYTVTALGRSGAAIEQSCPATTCTITGLTNGEHYTMSVVAHNEVGDSQPSNQSGEMVPDTKPGKPAPPLTEGVRSSKALVTWMAPPVNEGSPIATYVVELSGGGLSPQALDNGTAMTREIGGLRNGESYTFRVQAINESGMKSEWSDPSTPYVPSGPPFAPVLRSVTDAGGLLGHRLQVTYAPPAARDGVDGNNGDPITEYELTWGDGKSARVPAASTLEFDVDNGEFKYRLAACNRNGCGEGSAAVSGRAFAAPERPSLDGWEMAGDKTLLFVSGLVGDGAAVNGIRLSSDPSTIVPINGESGSVQVSRPFKVGAAVTGLRVAACSDRKCSEESTRALDFTPYTAPGDPIITYSIIPVGVGESGMLVRARPGQANGTDFVAGELQVSVGTRNVTLPFGDERTAQHTCERGECREATATVRANGTAMNGRLVPLESHATRTIPAPFEVTRGDTSIKVVVNGVPSTGSLTCHATGASLVSPSLGRGTDDAVKDGRAELVISVPKDDMGSVRRISCPVSSGEWYTVKI